LRLHEKYDEVSQRQEKLQVEVNHLQTANKDLAAMYERSLQYSYRDDLEIKGVPVLSRENCSEIVKKIAIASDIQISPHDISTSHRAFHPRPGQSRTPSIIVRFVRRDKRDEILHACRAKRLNTSCLGMNNGAQIFVNEHLTPLTKRLFFLASERKRERNWKFIWTSQCKVLLRKQDGGPVSHIASEQDLCKIV